MTHLTEQWKEDKLCVLLVIGWLLTVVASFFGSYLLPIELPGVGTWYAFRALLPITLILYVLCALKRRVFFWKDSTPIEKWCYIFIASMLVCCVVSVPRAIDLTFSARRMMNLALDLVFFFLGLRLCRNNKIRKLTIYTCAVMIAFIMLLGLCEVFFGGIVENQKINLSFFVLFRNFYSPVVFSGNTNDYNATIIMMLAVIMLDFLPHKGQKIDKGKLCYVVLTFSIGYFLAVAGEARLCIIGFAVLLAALFLYAIIIERKFRWVPILLLCFVLITQTVTRWHYIYPQGQTFFQELSENGKTDKSFFHVFKDPDKNSLKDEFIKVDSTTGQEVVNGATSAGARTKLLVHAWHCFWDSKTLGVGLGNSEILARDNEVIENAKYWNIHCFLARIIADGGLFALVPLCAIAFLMLRAALQGIVEAMEKKRRGVCGYSLWLLASIIIYPIVSTASSDAQDIFPMWLYLAILTLHCACAHSCLQSERKSI